MWMIDVTPVAFEALDGNTYSVRDMRDLYEYDTFISIPITSDDKIDEIVSRNTVYGENAEDNSFMVFHANVVELADNEYDMSKLKTIKIPVERI